jgi:hypothetical protein
MFLNMKQQIAAPAGTEKIEPVGNLRRRRTVAKAREFVPAAPNILSG